MAKRAIFEDVSGTRGEARPKAAGARPPARAAIRAWLWLLAGLVALMVLVGGLTRLTDSGLSITVWEPVMGAIPPLGQADWDAAFAAYKETEEFRTQNSWMTLEDFKPIYWWEWGHRFLGRLIGLVWAAGLLWFLARRTIPRGWTGRLVLPGLLGGVQGAIGWWMVHGGLDALDVPSYRLATHLGLAFVIFGLLVWYALRIGLDEVETLQARRRREGAVMNWTGVLAAVAFLQIVTGALVAGIDAGRSYVDWPLMQGQWFPPGAFELQPLWRNFFEDAGLVQFVHRMLGYALVLLGLAVAWRAARPGIVALRFWGRMAALALVAQMAIGIVTVMNAAPLELAILHQAGALAVMAIALRARFAAAYPPAQRITA
jgi:cytochrome c oxidase assembly protein subunit 15